MLDNKRQSVHSDPLQGSAMRERLVYKPICSTTIYALSIRLLRDFKPLLIEISSSGTPFTYIRSCVEKLFLNGNFWFFPKQRHDLPNDDVKCKDAFTAIGLSVTASCSIVMHSRTAMSQ